MKTRTFLSAALVSIAVTFGSAAGLPRPDGPAVWSATSEAPRLVATNAQIRFGAAGFIDSLRPCDQAENADQQECKTLHRKLADDVGAITVSRREDATAFVTNYLSGRYSEFLTCLRAGCEGNFVVDDGGAWADRWTAMLAFQACIHAAPAVWPKERFTGNGYRAATRLASAMAGKVADCPFSLSEADGEILKKFNLPGLF